MSPKNKISIALVLLAAVCMAIFLVAICPVIYEMQNIGQKIEEQNANIALLDARIEKVKEFKSFYENNAGNFAQYEKLLVDSQRPLNFFDFLENTADSCRVTATYSPGAPQKMDKDPWPSINFQIQLSGDLSSVMKYVKKIEFGSYLTEIHGLTISKGAQAGAASETVMTRPVKADLFIKVYTK